MNVNLFRKKVFADRIKLRILKKDLSGLSKRVLKTVTGVLKRERKKKAEIQKKGRPLKMEAEIANCYCEVTSVVSGSRDPMDCSLPGSSIHGIF